MNIIGWALNEQGKYVEAAAVHQQTLEVRRRVLGDRNPDTLMSAHLLAHSMEGLGRHEEAQRLLVEAVEGFRRVLGDGHWRTQDAMDCYAWWLLTTDPAHWRDPGTALHLAERVVEVTQRKNPCYLDTLALAQRETGDIQQAISTQQASLALLPEGSSPIGPEVQRELATDLIEARRIPALAPLLLAIHEARSEPGFNSSARLGGFMALVADFYDTWNRIEPGHGYDLKATQWQAKLSANR
jgi:tetratricopeptide (TPR) repeat protein